MTQQQIETQLSEMLTNTQQTFGIKKTTKYQVELDDMFPVLKYFVEQNKNATLTQLRQIASTQLVTLKVIETAFKTRTTTVNTKQKTYNDPLITVDQIKRLFSRHDCSKLITAKTRAKNVKRKKSTK